MKPKLSSPLSSIAVAEVPDGDIDVQIHLAGRPRSIFVSKMGQERSCAASRDHESLTPGMFQSSTEKD